MTDTLSTTSVSSEAPTDEPYLVVSTDTHAAPSLEHELRQYCPAAYLEEFDAFVSGFRRSQGDGGVGDSAAEQITRAIGEALGDDEQQKGMFDASIACAGLQDPYARVRHMDEDGVAADVIFAGAPNGEVLPFLAMGFDAGPKSVSVELRAVGSEIWNRWLADFVSVHPERHVGVMQIAVGDVDAAVREVERGRAAGLKAVNLPAPRADFPAYNHPVYEPLWSACDALDVTVLTHGGGGEFPLGVDGPMGMQLYLCETEWLSRRGLWQLIFGGVFERHPNVKLVFAEQRVVWVPETLRLLDSVYFSDIFHNARRELSKTPSEYWRTNCFIAGSFLAPFEAGMYAEVGPANLMWGSDYPHPEGAWPNTRLSMRHAFSGMPESITREILGTTPLRVFDLDEEKLRAVAAAIGPTPSEIAQPLAENEFPERKGQAFRERGSYS
jgi:predicted TIM-barrel fold metal-dependent hydrolase